MMCAECEKKKGVKSKYRGQTGRSTFERTKEHFTNWENKRDDSPLWKHSVECHNMNIFPVKMRVLDRCFGKPTRRMISEVLLIEDMDEEESLNNKKEYGYVRVPTVSVGV